MTQPKLHVRSGDTVQVLAGKDKGSTGKVLAVNLKTDRAIVEGVNIVKKHQRPTNDNPDGGIEEVEAPLHVSNLKVVESAAKESN